MSTEIKFRIDNKDAFDNVCGTDNCHLEIIEKSLGVKINAEKPDYFNNYNNYIAISDDNAKQAKDILQSLELLSESKTIETSDIEMMLKCNSQQINDILQSLKFQANFKTIKTSDVEAIITDCTQSYVADKSDNINTRFKEVSMHSNNQQNYVKAIKTQDLIFATGPKRTGKTYLAIACAIEALNDKNSSITRIVIASPDIYYIKDMNIKNAYILGIYDILYDLIGCEEATKLLKANIIEVSQLDIIEKRVLNNTFIILINALTEYTKYIENAGNIDDSEYPENIQNFTTCMGTESKMVITWNTDEMIHTFASPQTKNVLKNVLNNEPEISICHFYDYNIIERHKLVQKIIKLLEID
jgi:phosphate starvation-inducible PhoH-like protein